MAVKPFAFGARLSDKGRRVSVRADAAQRGRYVVEDDAPGRSGRRREHANLRGALEDLARTWRGRLH